MLKRFLQENNLIRVNVKAKDWKEAVKSGVELLTNAKIVEEKYFDSIVQGTEKYGPYYLICPGIAMPHSRPEDGVIKNGISIVTLENPVNFGNPDNDPVKILVSLAATDNVTHLDIMQEIVTVLSSEQNIEKIKNAASTDDIFEIF